LDVADEHVSFRHSLW